jgi:hypothetical protein
VFTTAPSYVPSAIAVVFVPELEVPELLLELSVADAEGVGLELELELCEAVVPVLFDAAASL